MPNRQRQRIQYAYFIEHLSRKLTLTKNKCSAGKNYTQFTDEPAKYMGAATRNNVRFGFGVDKKDVFFLRFNPRTTAASASELARQQAFGDASKLRAAWMHTLATATQIRADWNEGSAGSCKGIYKTNYTFYGWVTAVAFAVILDGGTVSSPWPAYTPA